MIKEVYEGRATIIQPSISLTGGNGAFFKIGIKTQCNNGAGICTMPRR